MLSLRGAVPQATKQSSAYIQTIVYRLRGKVPARGLLRASALAMTSMISYGKNKLEPPRMMINKASPMTIKVNGRWRLIEVE